MCRKCRRSRRRRCAACCAPSTGLAQSAAEANGDHQVLLVKCTNDMQNSASGGGGKNRQAQETDLIFEVVRQDRRPDRRRGARCGALRRSVSPVRRGGWASRLFLRPCRFFKSCSSESRTCAGMLTSRPPDCMVSREVAKAKREFVQMTLKLAVAGEAESADDANNRRGIRPQALGHGAHAEQHVFAGVLENRPDDFLALDAELVDALREMGGG